MAIETLTELERLGFPDLLLWLLTFAIVYGLLNQLKKPDSAVSRLIISIVAGLLVLMAAPANLIATISQMSVNLVFILLGILTLLIFLEVSKVKVGGKVHRVTKVDEEGRVLDTAEESTYKDPFKAYGLPLAIIFLIIVGLVFVGSGGLNFLGLQNISLPAGSTLGIAFFLIIILAVIIMFFEERS